MTVYYFEVDHDDGNISIEIFDAECRRTESFLNFGIRNFRKWKDDIEDGAFSLYLESDIESFRLNVAPKITNHTSNKRFNKYIL